MQNGRRERLFSSKYLPRIEITVKKVFLRLHSKVTEEMVVFLVYFLCNSFLLFSFHGFPIEASHFLSPKN